LKTVIGLSAWIRDCKPLESYYLKLKKRK